MGRRAQAVGQSFEAVMTFACTMYRNQQRAFVDRNGVRGQWRVSRGKPFFKAWPKGEQPPDYSGVVDGRFVCFDAKTTKNKRVWKIKKDSLHQIDYMRELAAHGAVCWFAIEFREYEFLVLRRVKKDQPSGVLQVSVDAIKKGVQPDGKLILVVEPSGGWYDWLPLVQEHWLAQAS